MPNRSTLGKSRYSVSQKRYVSFDLRITCGNSRGGGSMVRVYMNYHYDNIISINNLCKAWLEFIRGKKSKGDVAEFSLNLSQNIFRLHEDLRTKTYRHGSYEAFSINDPKPRSIHKATVRDRLLHHAIYRILYSCFDKRFIDDSYSCRKLKGTHRALKRFEFFARKVSKNNTKTCWVLKCDIKKFFASIDHEVMYDILHKCITDQSVLWLLKKVVSSFKSTENGKGLPLGNLTSQLLVNAYMNEFDQFVKHKLKVKYYIRYADDFVFLSNDKREFENLLPKLVQFLEEKLRLSLHPHKVSLATLSSGIDFLGWVHFPAHRVLRTATKKRMFRNLKEGGENLYQLYSYRGLLKHGNGHKLESKVSNLTLVHKSK